jgi:hypothetical protein
MSIDYPRSTVSAVFHRWQKERGLASICKASDAPFLERKRRGEIISKYAGIDLVRVFKSFTQ